MKVSAIPQGGSPGVNQFNTSNNSDRMAAAKAIAAGETPIRVTPSDTPVDPQVAKAKESIRRIKMRTNVSPDRFDGNIAEAGAIPDEVVPTQAVNEETKPLSPQFAALAKQRRALQVKEREIADREKALSSQPPSDGGQELIARLKSSPLSVLQEHGVTYDQLTEAILNNSDGINPEIHKLREEIRALKEGVDKNLSDRDTQAEQQVLGEMRREATELAKDGDTFAAVRTKRAVPQVIDLIHRTYKATGEVLDVPVAMQLVEDELIKDILVEANIEKVKSKLVPAPVPQAPQQRHNTIRTLTNRDSTSLGLSRRERAIMAMNGTLTKG